MSDPVLGNLVGMWGDSTLLCGCAKEDDLAAEIMLLHDSRRRHGTEDGRACNQVVSAGVTDALQSVCKLRQPSSS